MDQNRPTGRAITVAMTSRHPLPPAEGANYFHFTIANGEVQLLVGTVNLLQLHEAQESDSETVAVSPEITHRFLMSTRAFQHLQDQVAEIMSAIPQGHTL
jgi:hypothetical protein